jgi:hypothetical protein
MSESLIRKAFETRLAQWAVDQGIDQVAWENAEFEPTEEAYVQAFLVPGKTESLYLDLTGRDYVGIFQVNLCMPKGSGTAEARALAGSLDAAFEGSFAQDTIRVTLLSPMGLGPALPVDDRFVVPVSADYRVVT